MPVREGSNNVIDYVKNLAGTHPVASIAGATIGGGIIGSIIGGKMSSRSNKTHRRHKKVKKSHSKKRRTHNHKKRRYPHTAGKRRDTSHKRIRFTKRGQPYIIQRNGRAKFISNRSVSQSRKRKGGKY